MSEIRKSNYPREIQEEVVIPFKTWQWVLLIGISLQYYLFALFSPNLNLSQNLFWTITFISSIAEVFLIFLLPLFFCGGSLARVVRDRLREQCTFPLILLGVLGPLSQIGCALMQARQSGGSAIALSPYVASLRSLPLSWIIWDLVLELIRIAQNFSTLFLMLLILSIPSSRQRIAVLGSYFLYMPILALTGANIVNQRYQNFLPYGVPASPSPTFWVLENLLDLLAYGVVLWVLDRRAFPSFRPLLWMIILYSVGNICFSKPTGWFAVSAVAIELVIVVGGTLYFQPGLLRWPWLPDEEEALQT